jgi:ribokinase
MNIVVAGSINLDIVSYGERLPRPGETVHSARYAIGLGGKGANQAAAAARLGNAVAMIGRVGADAFGDQALSALQAFGVNTEAVLRDGAQATGIAIIGVDATGENAISVIGGANLAVDSGDLERAAAAIRGARVLLTQREIPEAVTVAACRMAHKAGAIAIHDPAPAPAGGLADALLREFDLLTPNESETEALTGIRPASPADAARAADRLIARGAQTVVVKMGALGVYAKGSSGEAFVPPFSVRAIDSVGAGDCFNAGLADALARGLALAPALRFAAACGALATTKYGAAAAAPTRAEVETLLAGG